jgi:hypothetical protein
MAFWMVCGVMPVLFIVCALDGATPIGLVDGGPASIP